MSCGNGVSLPFSSSLGLMTHMALGPPRAPWLTLGQIMGTPPPALEAIHPYFSFPFLASHSEVSVQAKPIWEFTGS